MIKSVKNIWEALKADMKEIEGTADFAALKEAAIADAKSLAAELKPLAALILADLIKLL